MARFVVTPDPLKEGDQVTINGYGFGAESTLTTALVGDNNDLTFEAVDGGAQGDDISVAYTDPAANDHALEVAVVGTAITVTLRTSGTGTILSTAEEIMVALNNDEDAAALIKTTVPAGQTGRGVVTAMVLDNLAGGVDGTASLELLHSSGATDVVRWDAIATTDGAFNNSALGSYVVEEVGELTVRGYLAQVVGDPLLVVVQKFEIFSE